MDEPLNPREEVMGLLRVFKPENIQSMVTGGRIYTATEIESEIRQGTEFGGIMYRKLEQIYANTEAFDSGRPTIFEFPD
jgi:hypothetical protein